MRSSRNIVVADDNEDSAEMLAEVLRRAGHHVRTAWDSYRATQLLADEPADVVFLDIAMPGRDGYDLARQIKREHEGTRMVIVSGFSGEAHLAKARAIGVDEVLTKPIRIDRIVPLVDRLCPKSSRASA